MRKKIGELPFQVIPVMIGVYLGFVVSNWSEGNKKKHQAEIFLKNLMAEMEENDHTLSTVIDYHTMLRDSCRYYADGELKLQKPNFFVGTRVLKLGNSAYTTGIQTGVINELPLEKIQAIHQLYTYQDNYNEYGTLQMENLIAMDFSGQEEDMRKIVRFLSLTMTDIVNMENDLVAGYKQIKGTLVD